MNDYLERMTKIVDALERCVSKFEQIKKENEELKFALTKVVNETKYGPLLPDGTIALARKLTGYKSE